MTEARKDALLQAFDRFGYANRKVQGGDFSFEAVSAHISATNRLLDAAVDMGMSPAEADLEGWAAQRVTRYLCEA